MCAPALRHPTVKVDFKLGICGIRGGGDDDPRGRSEDALLHGLEHEDLELPLTRGSTGMTSMKTGEIALSDDSPLMGGMMTIW